MSYISAILHQLYRIDTIICSLKGMQPLNNRKNKSPQKMKNKSSKRLRSLGLKAEKPRKLGSSESFSEYKELCF